MPRLNGNSSHGSKPITSLSRTLSCSPHCCPQKQQCVFTSLSGSTLVDRRWPAITDRCGPKRWIVSYGSTGSRAMSVLVPRGEPLVERGDPVLEGAAPRRPLGEAEQRAAAARADLLVV